MSEYLYVQVVFDNPDRKIAKTVRINELSGLTILLKSSKINLFHTRFTKTHYRLISQYIKRHTIVIKT